MIGRPATNGRRPMRLSVQDDLQRRPVEDVLGQDVGRLVREDGLRLRLVEQRDELGVEDHDRAARADRHRVGDRALREVEVVLLLEVERLVDLEVEPVTCGSCRGPSFTALPR